MNFNPVNVRRDFMRMLKNFNPGDCLEVLLYDQTKWFIMSLQWCPTAIAPYCIFSPCKGEPIIASDLEVDEDGVTFLDGNQVRGFYWVDVACLAHQRSRRLME